MSSKGYCSSARTSIPVGAYYEVLAADFGTIQADLPLITTNEVTDYYFVVPNNSGAWKTQKKTDFMCPDGTIETVGIMVGSVDCISPTYPGTSTAVTEGEYMSINGYLFICTAGGGGSTASTFIGFSNFDIVYGGTTVDGAITWTCLGKAVLVRMAFANITGTTPGSTPVAQEYDLFQL